MTSRGSKVFGRRCWGVGDLLSVDLKTAFLAVIEKRGVSVRNMLCGEWLPVSFVPARA